MQYCIFAFKLTMQYCMRLFQCKGSLSRNTQFEVESYLETARRRVEPYRRDIAVFNLVATLRCPHRHLEVAQAIC
jgi:hypothetical protein